MLNEELQDQVSLLLGKMKSKIDMYQKQIDAFKKYDAGRKKYYGHLAIKIGELEAYVQELEHNSGITKLKAQNEELKKQVKALEAKLYLAKGCVDLSDSDLSIWAAKAIQAKEVIAAKNKEIKRLNESISSLVSKQCKN